jgi:apolipoprotein N-acyltransferase
LKLFYLLFSAALYVLSYSPFDYKPLIFLSLVIFLVVVENLSFKEKIKYTFFYALLIHALGVSWVSESLITYGFMGLTGSIIVTLLFVIAVSIPYIIIALFHKPIHKNNIYNINVIAVLFLIAEYIKSLLFGGFPWLLVSISQNETIFNFIYPVFGSYMVTYMVVLSAAIFYKTIYMKQRYYVAISIILASTYMSGYFFSINNENYDKENISFSLYQPNIYPDRVYNPNEYKKIIKQYINFLDRKDPTDLTILPETITPYVLEKNNKLLESIKKLSDRNNIIIAGFFTESENKYFNSMVFFSDEIVYYHKRKLVPFGEYTPWYDSIIKLSGSLNIPLSNLSNGTNAQEDIFFQDTKILPLICFESTFPSLLKSNVENEIIINISNDGWFGKSLAPYQHLQITQIRALEFNRYILRATNTGLSAVINNNGEIIEYIPINKEGVITGFVPINLDTSFYSRYGDICILMLLFLTLLSQGLSRLRK